MAPVAAKIHVCFTSDYTGLHRVCYRISGTSGGYTCIDVNCAGGGAQCCVDVPIVVDNETCNTLVFEGYAQAECQDISSTDGRIPFVTTFVPSPSCKRYLATCQSAGIATISLTGGGSGYSVGTHPSVSFSGGGGGGATATANVGTGFITVLTLSNAGSGYNSGSYLAVPLSGGTGAGATADITVSGGIATITAIHAIGNGYTTGDVLIPNAASMGGSVPLTNINFTVQSDLGVVVSITLNTAGSGFTSVPGVAIAPGKTGTATATATLGYCGTFNVTSCGGTTAAPVGDGWIQPGQSVDFCTKGTPPAPTNYSIAQDGNCLCNCQVATLSATGGRGTVQFKGTLCNGNIFSITLDPLGSPSSTTGCVVTGSVIMNQIGGATGTITYHGAC